MYFHDILIKIVRITALEAVPFKMLHRLHQDKKKKSLRTKFGAHLTCLAHKHKDRDNQCLIFKEKTDWIAEVKRSLRLLINEPSLKNQLGMAQTGCEEEQEEEGKNDFSQLCKCRPVPGIFRAPPRVLWNGIQG